MRKEELKDLLGISEEHPPDDEAVWPVIVEFVAEWLEESDLYADGEGPVGDFVAKIWRKDMTATDGQPW